MFDRLGAFQPAFLERVLVPFSAHRPDLRVLRVLVERLVSAAGIDSRKFLPCRTTAALAMSLGLPLTEFPGGHLRPVERPRQFAEALIALFDAHRGQA
ncbi:hypothetical protein [Stackebrandtia soli]|uniref:hypothetical protein n=1 Tax=Stackebrandtia soli TaxID=1892856 RepID=UPI0039E97BB1